jgi:hypothetical protein
VPQPASSIEDESGLGRSPDYSILSHPDLPIQILNYSLARFTSCEQTALVLGCRTIYSNDSLLAGSSLRTSLELLILTRGRGAEIQTYRVHRCLRRR